MGATAAPKAEILSNGTWLKQLGRTVADLLFPPRCVGCRTFGAWLCDRCQGTIERIQPPVCLRCGWPLDRALEPERRSECGRCDDWPARMARPDRLLAFGFHAGLLRQAVHLLKYEDMQVLAAPLGRLMADGWSALAPADWSPDLIVPVPLHAARERERGYNQAALLARELGRHLGRPIVDKALIRTRKTRPQVGLSLPEREANVHDAFGCAAAGLAPLASLAGRRVLLVDDVCTTGATLGAACRALREAGIASVWAYTLARAGDVGGPG